MANGLRSRAPDRRVIGESHLATMRWRTEGNGQWAMGNGLPEYATRIRYQTEGNALPADLAIPDRG